MEFPSEFVYEKYFSLKIIQENDYFKENYTINDIIEEIFSINQHRTISYIENIKSISVVIPLSFKSKGNEIKFELEQRNKTNEDKFNELYELIGNNNFNKKLENIEFIVNELNKKINKKLEEKIKK